MNNSQSVNIETNNNPTSVKELIPMCRNEFVKFDRSFQKQMFDRAAMFAIYAIEHFAAIIVCHACSDNPLKATDILSGKCNFNKTFSAPKRVFGIRFIDLAIESKNSLIPNSLLLDLKDIYPQLRKQAYDHQSAQCFTYFDKIKAAEACLYNLYPEEKTLVEKITSRIRTKFARNEDSLEDVLRDCSKASTEGYDYAMKYLKRIGRSIDDSVCIMQKCIDELDTYNINDASIKDNVKKQLSVVRCQFGNAHSHTLHNVQEKKKQTEKLNITVFGRTTAGKSTLMEILTHGNGDSMGKGGQRTTRDVKSYEWRGMQVTDVPGIEAYGGEEDDNIAEGAAVYADLILFLVSTSNPGKEEAEWYNRLQEKDKPIICIFNYFASIDSNRSYALFERALHKIGAMQNDEGLKGAIREFKRFLGEQDFEYVIVHLLSKFISSKPEFLERKKELECASNFSNLEKLIISKVKHDGLLFRKKCYLAIVDEPIYNQMSKLFAFSAEQYEQYVNVRTTKEKLYKWKEDFNRRELTLMGSKIKDIFNSLRDEVPGFVEDNVENENAQSRWERIVEGRRIESRVEGVLSDIGLKCKNEIESRFKELIDQINITSTINSSIFNSSIKGSGVVNWKAIVGIGGAIVSGVVGLIFGGWVALGIGAVFGFFAWLFDSKEDKLRRAREKMSRKLNSSINKMEYDVQQKAYEYYQNNIYAMQHDAMSRLDMLCKSLLALANTERALAINYCKDHTDISKKIIELTLENSGFASSDYDKIIKVARIPAKTCILVLKEKCLTKRNIDMISTKLGNKETVSYITLNTSLPLQNQARYLFSILGLDRINTRVYKVDAHQVIYIPKGRYSEGELDKINLAMQLLNTHIIQKA